MIDVRWIDRTYGEIGGQSFPDLASAEPEYLRILALNEAWNADPANAKWHPRYVMIEQF